MCWRLGNPAQFPPSEAGNGWEAEYLAQLKAERARYDAAMTTAAEAEAECKHTPEDENENNNPAAVASRNSIQFHPGAVLTSLELSEDIIAFSPKDPLRSPSKKVLAGKR